MKRCAMPLVVWSTPRVCCVAVNLSNLMQIYENPVQNRFINYQKVRKKFHYNRRDHNIDGNREHSEIRCYYVRLNDAPEYRTVTASK
jgi:hypothetical protein